VLHYREAERYMPGDPRLEHNLTYARSLRSDQIAPSGERALVSTLLAWHTNTPVRLRFGITMMAWLAFWVIMFIRMRRLSSGWGWLALLSALVWVVGGASVAVEALTDGGGREGVLIADDVVVRKGNGTGFEPQFEQPINDGVEFRVLGERGGWLHIELPDGKSGWIDGDQAEIIGG
jgi:hypothetical protein